MPEAAFYTKDEETVIGPRTALICVCSDAREVCDRDSPYSTTFNLIADHDSVTSAVGVRPGLVSLAAAKRELDLDIS